MQIKILRDNIISILASQRRLLKFYAETRPILDLEIQRAAVLIYSRT